MSYLLEGSVRRRRRDDHDQRAAHLDRDRRACRADRFEGERSKLGALQVEAVARLANSLGVELVKAEALRAMRERPKQPRCGRSLDAWNGRFRTDLQLLASLNDAIGLFERALAIDPTNVPALVGLSWTLEDRVNNFPDDNAAGDRAHAEQAIERALARQPDNSAAHVGKSPGYQR